MGSLQAPRPVLAASTCSKPKAPKQDKPAMASLSRRQALGGLAGLALLPACPRAAGAVGLESMDLPFSLEQPDFVKELSIQNQKVLDAAEDSFQNSELLKGLLEKSEANKGK
jgi:hypothetical protein